MAKVFEPVGDLARALRLLEQPGRSNTAQLRKAIALVHGARNFTPAELSSRFRDSDHVAFNVETGRLMLLDKKQEHVAETWLTRAGQLAVQACNSEVSAPHKRLEGWTASSRKPRNATGAASAIRAAQSPVQKMAIVMAEPTVHHASLSTVDYAKRGRDPYDAYENATEQLQITGVRRALDGAGFRDDVVVDDQDVAYEVYGLDDSAVVRRTQLIGSYARKFALQNRERHARLETVQSVTLTQQSVFGVDPEWHDLLFASNDLESATFTSLEPDSATEIGAFIASRDEAFVPLTSTLYAIQDWQSIGVQPF